MLPLTHRLHKPIVGERIPQATFSYFKTRNKLRLFDVVKKEFKKSGLSQAELAIRMGKGKDRICKLLAAPGNWTSDTASEILFAISGSELVYSIGYPFERPTRNQNRPEWSVKDIPSSRKQESEPFKMSVSGTASVNPRQILSISAQM
jgi:transcriptional regulator with XRE-family HTH domain